MARHLEKAFRVPGLRRRGGEGVNHGRARSPLPSDQPGVRDLAGGRPQIEDRRSQMLGRVHCAIDVQDFLGARNADVVGRLAVEVPESGPEPRAGERSQPGAARTAMEIEAQIRSRAPQRAQLRRQDLIDIGIAFEDGAKPWLDHDRHMQVRPEAPQD